MRTFEFTLTGKTPLLMHWDNIDWADQIVEIRNEIKKKDKTKSKAGDDRTPPWSWIGSAYVDDDNVVLPTDNLRTCLMKAAAKVSFKNQETYKKILPTGVIFHDVYCELRCGPSLVQVTRKSIENFQTIDGTFADQCRVAKTLGFELMAKRAAVGSSKHVRVRPMFKKWQASGTVDVVDDRISSDTLAEIFTIAGRYIGLGDWRPDSPKSPGPYGTFSVELVKA